ncbi:Mannan polymerase II complex anp1 subunit [Schizosaccharomyces pombe]|uniref:Mannan polymerase II complex anp1 subunit n=1 Tax=Schizosaccharomyces pombe (strain 972 / ATCC 24843) TaxID=284812 RepID=ANP1_SCHPO|nr:putative Anp family mannosyltransferase complex subunit [Schizosaccharomyces pombe]O74745.1 RecName: Full=Mannan polymerase II complex anp1 subunit; Short=M-Pol II subunit anp1 [Schizosaccharomyces pombe 972h-]CAA21290.2 mannosyltransferase complex subunit, Anp family (predicted) [Schizosaccharomyces pombe]|eukprot:NP_595421.2 putative Anp family mannosyltransferase complex subunit [Schizosaccharomyces pombe]
MKANRDFGRDGGPFSITPNRFQPKSSGNPIFRQKTIRTVGIIALTLVLFLFFHRSFFSSFGEFPSFSSTANAPNSDVQEYDLRKVMNAKFTGDYSPKEKVLICAPLRNAAEHLNMFFGHMNNLTYPHELIDLAFLISDTDDNTLEVLKQHLDAIQNDEDESKHFNNVLIMLKDFGAIFGQEFSDRHGFAAQGPRRKLMARARNWLLSAAIQPYHSWVYWRDVDVETAPNTILEDLMRHDKDIIVPNVYRPLPDWLGNEQPYDLNSWAESETALQLADTLGEDDVIVEGYAEYATWRPHLAYLRDPNGDPSVEMPLDGIGGVSIMSKAKVHLEGCEFPAFSFEKHAETEGFGKMAKRMGFSVYGLPHYVIWHIYEPSDDDKRIMAEMERERKEREAAELEEAKKYQTAGFTQPDDQGAEEGPLAHADDHVD